MDVGFVSVGCHPRLLMCIPFGETHSPIRIHGYSYVYPLRGNRLSDSYLLILDAGYGMADNGSIMTTDVHKIAEQVKALSEEEFEEFLDWLARYGLELTDAWDKEIERDAQPGGRLDAVLGRVRKDIAEGKTRSLDEFSVTEV